MGVECPSGLMMRYYSRSLIQIGASLVVTEIASYLGASKKLDAAKS